MKSVSDECSLLGSVSSTSTFSQESSSAVGPAATRRLIVLFVVFAEAKYQQAEEKEDDDAHAHTQRDERVVEIRLRQGATKREMRGGAQNVSDAGENADYEERSNGKDRRPQMPEHRVCDVEQDDDHQDAVDCGHD